MVKLEKINYVGHFLTSSSYNQSEVNYLVPDSMDDGSLSVNCTINKLGFHESRANLKITASFSVTAKTKDAKEVFRLEAEYESLFDGTAEINEENFSKYEWYFKKNVYRSGKVIADDHLKNTPFRQIYIPSFVPEPESKD